MDAPGLGNAALQGMMGAGLGAGTALTGGAAAAAAEVIEGGGGGEAPETAPSTPTLMDAAVSSALADQADGTASGKNTYLWAATLSGDLQWCGSFAAYHYVQALTEAGVDTDTARRDLGQWMASDTKIKDHFGEQQTLDFGTGEDQLTAQYLSWHDADAAQNGTDSAALSGDAQQDVALFGAGDLMLMDSSRWNGGLSDKRSDHITMVSGTSEIGDNLAFLHTVEGNGSGIATDGGITTGAEVVENTYMMVPTRDESGNVSGYEAFRFEVEVGGVAMDIPDLIALAESDPQNPLALHIDEDTTPEQLKAQIEALKQSGALTGATYLMDSAQIDGQLDFEQAGGPPAQEATETVTTEAEQAEGGETEVVVEEPVLTEVTPEEAEAEAESNEEEATPAAGTVTLPNGTVIVGTTAGVAGEGEIPVVDETTGLAEEDQGRVDTRLADLGYLPDGGGGDQAMAIRNFQIMNGLDATGTWDQATLDALWNEGALESSFVSQMKSNTWNATNDNDKGAGGNNCGPTSVLMALAAQGLYDIDNSDPETDIETIRDLTGTTEGDTTTRAELESSLDEYSAGSTTISDMDDIAASVLAGQPVVLLGVPNQEGTYYDSDSFGKINEGSQHWITVIGYNPETDEYVINDPLSRNGTIVVTSEELDTYAVFRNDNSFAVGPSEPQS